MLFSSFHQFCVITNTVRRFCKTSLKAISEDIDAIHIYTRKSRTLIYPIIPRPLDIDLYIPIMVYHDIHKISGNEWDIRKWVRYPEMSVSTNNTARRYNFAFRVFTIQKLKYISIWNGKQPTIYQLIMNASTTETARTASDMESGNNNIICLLIDIITTL